MTMLQSTLKISEDSKKDILLEIISDKYCRIILDSVMDKPRSVTEISIKTGISVSTIYRKIQVLCDNKLLRTSGSITDDGKKSFYYQSKIKSIYAYYDEGKIEVEVVFN